CNLFIYCNSYCKLRDWGLYASVKQFGRDWLAKWANLQTKFAHFANQIRPFCTIVDSKHLVQT
ncbi:hypothetical protein, partial [Prevotella koreensis]|uniref:hypothetical protein n=1 Tax=Prevotella koreensis TaxID=2490854 RepID=UPI0028E2A04E